MGNERSRTRKKTELTTLPQLNGNISAIADTSKNSSRQVISIENSAENIINRNRPNNGSKNNPTCTVPAEHSVNKHAADDNCKEKWKNGKITIKCDAIRGYEKSDFNYSSCCSNWKGNDVNWCIPLLHSCSCIFHKDAIHFQLTELGGVDYYHNLIELKREPASEYG